MKYIQLIILLLNSIVGFSNTIDKLTTQQEIEIFVDSVSGHSAVFSKVTGSHPLYNKRYLKTDLDHNGTTDLLVNDIRIFAIVDTGSNNFCLKYIGTAHKECRLAKIDAVNNTQLFIVRWQLGYEKTIGPVFSAKTDTLVNLFNGFIEYNKNPTILQVKKITVNTGDCFGGCPVYELDIFDNRELVLRAKRNLPKTGMLKSTLSPTSYSQLLDLLDYINIPGLQDQYTIDATDNPSIRVKIFYSSGTKEIHDYGLEGTLGLQQLYTIIEDIIKHQNWN